MTERTGGRNWARTNTSGVVRVRPSVSQQSSLLAATIGESRIFLEGGDFGNPSERSERALRGSGLTGE